MAGRSAAGALGSSRSGRRIGIDDPIVADPGEELDPGVAEAVSDGDRVVAGVEDEQRRLTIGGKHVDQSADLVGGGCGCVLLGCDPPDVDWRRPAVGRERQLADPLE